MSSPLNQLKKNVHLLGKSALALLVGMVCTFQVDKLEKLPAASPPIPVAAELPLAAAQLGAPLTAAPPQAEPVSNSYLGPPSFAPPARPLPTQPLAKVLGNISLLPSKVRRSLLAVRPVPPQPKLPLKKVPANEPKPPAALPVRAELPDVLLAPPVEPYLPPPQADFSQLQAEPSPFPAGNMVGHPQAAQPSATGVAAPPLQGDHKTTGDSKGIVPASCPSCAGLGSPSGHPPAGAGLLGLRGTGSGTGPCCSCGSFCKGCRPKCVPGQQPCACDEHCGWLQGTYFGKFASCLYECLCCPDPCYDPQWLPVADAAFFTPSVRPQTQTRFHWDAGTNVVLPDRSEFFWARADGSGKGPKPNAGFLVAPSVRYHDINMYTEAAAGRIGVIVDMTYRSVDPVGAAHGAGFGDMKVGTKTLLFDCELLQVGMQFLTYIPVGQAMKGTGVGHVSLEPSLLLGVRLGPDTYLQSQVAEWIPLGGDPDYAGAVLHYHLGLNHVLCRFNKDIPVLLTTELNGWSFQDGSYTDPVLGSFQQASGYTYLSLGPGLRLCFCSRCDLGFATSFALTEAHFPLDLFRTQFRWRF